MIEKSQISSGPPLIRLTKKFQVAWQTAAARTRASPRYVLCNLGSWNSDVFQHAFSIPSGILVLGCLPYPAHDGAWSSLLAWSNGTLAAHGKANGRLCAGTIRGKGFPAWLLSRGGMKKAAPSGSGRQRADLETRSGRLGEATEGW